MVYYKHETFTKLLAALQYNFGSILLKLKTNYIKKIAYKNCFLHYFAFAFQILFIIYAHFPAQLATISFAQRCPPTLWGLVYLDSQLRRSTLTHLSPTPRLHLQPVFINVPHKAQQNRGRGSGSSPSRPNNDGNIVSESLRFLHPLVQYTNNHFHMQQKGSRH